MTKNTPRIIVKNAGKNTKLIQFIFDTYIIPKIDWDKIAKEAHQKWVDEVMYGKFKNDRK